MKNYLELLRAENAKKNPHIGNCINPVKTFTQFMQFTPNGKKNDQHGPEPPALAEAPADPMAAVRALNRMTQAGFALELAGCDLRVSPADRLTEKQCAFIRAHKPALVRLLTDAEDVLAALVRAGPAGLAWREGTPGNWPDNRLLAAGEVLYSSRRMVNRGGRRYLWEAKP